MGEASRWWLHHSLNSLNKSLNGKLNVYIGKPEEILIETLKNNNLSSVYWNRCYDPWRITNDSIIKSELKKLNVECKSFNGSLLWEPWLVLKKDKSLYKKMKFI